MWRLEEFLLLAAHNFKLFAKIQDQNKKIKNLQRSLSFPRPIKWYHPHADLIWPDGTVPLNRNNLRKNISTTVGK